MIHPYTHIGQVLREIFNEDFSPGLDPRQFRDRFFAKTLTIPDLAKICNAVIQGNVHIGGVTVQSALHISGRQTGDQPFIILAQLHGNEPAGLAGIALALALAQAGLLERDVVAAIGNPYAAKQYFEAYMKDPHARQETRDAFRCGLDANGNLLPDMNRIPIDFMQRGDGTAHTARAQELYALAHIASGILDIHTARGNMTCITDHKRDADLKHSPIRSILVNLAEAISANASTATTVQTLKTILSPLPNIECQTGIEAGRHESPEAPYNAAAFTLSTLHTLGLTSVPPLAEQEDGAFTAYGVRPRITYADLDYGEGLRADDKVYMARACQSLASVPERSDTVVVRQESGYALQSVAEFTQKPAGPMEYAIYQYDEMEAVAAGQVVAVAIPSGTPFKTREAFSGIFVSKSAALYDKDPAVGPWPVAADKLASVKFCYPCEVKLLKLPFD